MKLTVKNLDRLPVRPSRSGPPPDWLVRPVRAKAAAYGRASGAKTWQEMSRVTPELSHKTHIALTWPARSACTTWHYVFITCLARMA